MYNRDGEVKLKPNYDNLTLNRLWEAFCAPAPLALSFLTPLNFLTFNKQKF